MQCINNDNYGDTAAPLDFNSSSSSEGNPGKLCVAAASCPLCLKARSNFYCKNCINSGDFYHSSGQSVEKFGDRKFTYTTIKTEKGNVEDMCNEILKPKCESYEVKSEIALCKERILLRKFLIQEKNKSITDKRQNILDLKSAISTKKDKCESYNNRVRKIKEFVLAKDRDLKKIKNELLEVQDELKQQRRKEIGHLVKYIFPIEPVELGTSMKKDSKDDMSLLEEVFSAKFVHGREEGVLVLSGSGGGGEERYHRIVGPVLPASGDYSAYVDWVSANRDMPSTSNHPVDLNPAYSIGAGLVYTTQLANMLAYCLGLTLPVRLCHSEFSWLCHSEAKFYKRVARLNWNVLTLCLSQNVSPRLLNPRTTLDNILLLLEPGVSDLGRSALPDVDPLEARDLEEALRPDFNLRDDSSEDSEDELSVDWEAVPSALPESEPRPSPPVSQPQPSSSSLAGGLITSTAASIASFWRGLNNPYR